MATPTYITKLAALHACPEALYWLRTSRHPDLAAAWAACPRGDWMLWLAGKLAGPPGDPSRIPLVLAACDCVELALPFVPVGEKRPRRALETARAWTRGVATLEEVRAAAYDAHAAHAAHAAYAAYAAAYVVYAAHTARAAYAAYAAADAAVYAAHTARAADSRADTLSRCADIVRKHFPSPPSLE